jgi:hypothetical protein
VERGRPEATEQEKPQKVGISGILRKRHLVIHTGKLKKLEAKSWRLRFDERKMYVSAGAHWTQ